MSQLASVWWMGDFCTKQVDILISKNQAMHSYITYTLIYNVMTQYCNVKHEHTSKETSLWD